MTEQIDYNRIVDAQGGRKWVNQKGIRVLFEAHTKTIKLHSINAKDGRQTTDLRLEIPVEHINEVIDALKQYV